MIGRACTAALVAVALVGATGCSALLVDPVPLVRPEPGAPVGPAPSCTGAVVATWADGVLTYFTAGQGVAFLGLAAAAQISDDDDLGGTEFAVASAVLLPLAGLAAWSVARGRDAVWRCKTARALHRSRLEPAARGGPHP